LRNRYLVASNRGSWCIYSEMSNDIAIIAFADVEHAQRFASPLQKLHAGAIDEMVRDGANSVYPFTRLVPEWRLGLIENYARPHVGGDDASFATTGQTENACACGGHAAEIRVDGTIKQLYPKFETIESADWCSLLRCPDCGQLWAVDEWDKYQVQLAIKLLGVIEWQQDNISRRKAFLLRSRGGYESGKCFWMSCAGRQIKGSAYCLDHSYAVGMRI